MDTETKAALDRLRSEGQGENVYPSWFPDYDMEVRKDVRTLADAYLADQYGVLVNFDDATSTATIETARSVIATMTAAGFRVLGVETIKACPMA